jgi:hypothetical protein
MVTRVSLSIITQSEATDEGKFIIKGSGRRGALAVELPGEAASQLITSLLAFLPKLSKASLSGTKPSFQMAGFEVKETSEPGMVRLYLRCAIPADSPPDTEVIDIGFALSWDQMAEMGEKLSATAKKRPQATPRIRN